MIMMALAVLLLCLGSGLIGGVFFAFSSFVMKALAELPAEQGVRAMQRINVVVLSPLFLGVFVGTALLSIACGVASVLSWNVPRSPLVLLAGILYLLGSFGVTVVCNVPRNERLAKLEPGSREAGAYWPAYLREWLLWNHVRTAASVAAAALAAVSLL